MLKSLCLCPVPGKRTSYMCSLFFALFAWIFPFLFMCMRYALKSWQSHWARWHAVELLSTLDECTTKEACKLSLSEWWASLMIALQSYPSVSLACIRKMKQVTFNWTWTNILHISLMQVEGWKKLHKLWLTSTFTAPLSWQGGQRQQNLQGHCYPQACKHTRVFCSRSQTIMFDPPELFKFDE